MSGVIAINEAYLATLARWESACKASNARPVKTGTEVCRCRKSAQRKPKPGLAPVEESIRLWESISQYVHRSQAPAEAQRYGEGAIGVGPFRRIFNDLKRTQHIHCVEGKPRDRDGRWSRSEEPKPGEIT